MGISYNLVVQAYVYTFQNESYKRGYAELNLACLRCIKLRLNHFTLTLPNFFPFLMRLEILKMVCQVSWRQGCRWASKNGNTLKVWISSNLQILSLCFSNQHMQHLVNVNSNHLSCNQALNIVIFFLPCPAEICVKNSFKFSPPASKCCGLCQ